eukprot:CAMPEP_0202684858 /NCGR_PEP_ID=MMETSP1385-20130828/456_1 /ASSEMBLY_ACC=CAM_ASM_000861 /TAXON_ID=933848 /ORGANISM="Elphidium margaritaceum" /LENGTH=195 /DNA_ID=CAMNT_0049339071 /DNA_START=61 /DNA_END=648 /DNA_ORIENTATION=+
MAEVAKAEAAPVETPQKETPQQPAESKIQLTNPKFSEVEQLSPASVGFNLIVKVGNITPIMNRLNLDGTRLQISEAIIGDSTACIILSLRNDQITMVGTGDVLILRNAKIDMVNNGYMRVAIDRWGLIEKVDAKQMDKEINLENNLSDVEYELVKETQNEDGGRGYGRGRGRGRGRGGRGYSRGRGGGRGYGRRY